MNIDNERKRADALLVLLSEAVDDLEKQRVATQNRLHAFAMHLGTVDTREGQRMQEVLEQVSELEKETVKDLERAMSTHPLGEFIHNKHGVGFKQAARFIGTIGDPAERETASQLNRYCGLDVVDGVAPSRKSGQRITWNPQARAKIWLIANSVIKHRQSPYRAVYDEARQKYEDVTHQRPCVRCGPSGTPAPVGSPLNDGHKHARAMRAVQKAFLEDLWQEARKEQGLPYGKSKTRTNSTRNR